MIPHSIEKKIKKIIEVAKASVNNVHNVKVSMGADHIFSSIILLIKFQVYQ